MSGTFDNENEALWMAYLDGQMTASEASAFDAGLSPEMQERLAAEMRLEAGLAERLCDDTQCPEALWKRLQLEMNNGPVRRRRLPFSFAAAAAACLVVGAAWFGGVLTRVFPGFSDNIAEAGPVLAIPDETLEAYASHAETADTRESIERFLLDNNIHLALNDVHAMHPTSPHEVKLVGACTGKCKEKTLYEVMFTCCGQPVKIAIAKQGTSGAAMIAKSRKCHEVQESVVMGEYVVAVIGKHDAPDLIDILKPRPDAIV